MEKPVKYINHEVADTLDSTNAFEGPEKLLEIWFAPKEPHVSAMAQPRQGLLAVPRQVWETMLNLVQCKVLSMLSYEGLDSYVLSESSFFVYPHVLILKTCGTTTLLDGLPRMLEIVADYTRTIDPSPLRIFYSRRSFMFPDRQLHPHRSWEDETAVLKQYFPDGQAMEFGAGKDKWYMFSCVQSQVGKTCDNFNDFSLEIMMTDLDPAAANLFSFDAVRSLNSPPGTPTSANPMESSMLSIDSMASSVGCEPDDDDPGHHQGNILTKATEIDEIYPTVTNQAIDSFAFAPCGYSCNGVIDAERYFSIHVTPETGFSYASFETNVPPQRFGMTHLDVIQKVLSIFRPANFTLVLFEEGKPKLGLPAGLSDKYSPTCEVSQSVGNYKMWYQTYRLT
ncbi:S-adenosylmethionine decarboxylase proenzyme [Wickerhamiella sorbophila]|uniref:S-adenosylmethionine decarboxylase proenzyme n=1 Tax=Wickerhamiella sorbophila TaxID=45607 RepID=A0A2T0FJ61_9ASCO|nr:S-adenosylmethionine decarboxylase proenzyme [Wickerhamiella sorbophila]PRT55044.1 S-adenosylmethionine decarboxylase proenzyme [Wickerhamiella sorbophila]